MTLVDYFLEVGPGILKMAVQLCNSVYHVHDVNFVRVFSLREMDFSYFRIRILW